MKDKLEKIGKEANVQTQWGFYIRVTVVDYKKSYGKDRWLVEPVAGTGREWVENVEFEEE